MSIMSYRELATHCRYRAAGAPTEALRAEWLKLASTWLRMEIDRAGHSSGGNIKALFEVSASTTKIPRDEASGVVRHRNKGAAHE